jgi:hypothetical protein
VGDMCRFTSVLYCTVLLFLGVFSVKWCGLNGSLL